MPNKEHMLARHEAHIDRLEYELGLFTNAGLQTDPPEAKEDLAQHVRHALDGEREIVEILKRLSGISTTVVHVAEQ
jgi:nicotinate-nucleotide pyrophosphorylase